MDPLLSIIVPVHNGARFFSELMQTIERQAYAPLDLIVVDDGSTDEIESLARQHGARYVRQDKRGVSAARNHGLTHARGELILFFDVDDLMPPGKLYRQVHYLIQHPEVDLVSGHVAVSLLPTADDRNLFSKPETLPLMNVGAAIVRRAVCERVGGFDETVTLGEDLDWFMRALERDVRVVVLRETTLVYRQHDGNATRGSSGAAHAAAMMRVIQRSARRRRGPDGTVRPVREWLSCVAAEDDDPGGPDDRP